MDGNRLPSKEANSHFYYCNLEDFSSSFPVAVRDGVDLISLIIAGKNSPLPQAHPKQVKDELIQAVTQQQHISSVNVTRQRKIILTTKDTQTAQEILKLDSFLGNPVDVYIQSETITSRFLLRLDASISCEEVAAEISEQGLSVYEIRRFMRSTTDGLQPTPSVLVTIIGTSLPSDIKLWYEVHRITQF